MKTSSNFLFVVLFCLFGVACEREIKLPAPGSEVTSETLQLAVSSSTCVLKGESLTVYDPDSQDFEAYNSDNYTVEWKIGDVRAGTGIRIECVCGNTYTVKVTDETTGNTGEMEYVAIDCDDE
jgi:hypothetical protein